MANKMIESVQGLLIEQGENYILVQVGPLALRINFLRHQGYFPPGEMVTIYTHFLIREDQLSLYGFLEKGELEVFRSLLKINGVGPRLAQNIIARISPGELREAVERNNPQVLEKVPGIGKKTANKILFSLKEKTSWQMLPGKDWKEALDALIALGFDESEALDRISRVNLKKEKITPAEIIKEALKG